MKKLFTFFAALACMASVAMADNINVVATQASARFYPEDNDLYITLQNADYGFAFDVLCAAGSQDIVDGQTYTLDDMLVDYSYGVDQAAQAYLNYVTASITRNNGSYTAVVVADDGNTYNITYTVVPPITNPTDTVMVSMTNVNYKNRAYDLVADMGAIQLIGHSDDNNYLMNVVFYTNSFAGNYTLADRYEEDQYFMLYKDVDATGQGTEVPCNNLLGATVTGSQASCTAEIKWVDADGTLYWITFNYADPVASAQNTFTANNLTITRNENYDLYLMYYNTYVYDFEASNEEYILRGSVYNTMNDDAFGAWDYDDGSIEFNLYDASTQVAGYDPFNGIINIANGANNTITLTGTALFFGDTEWTFNVTGGSVGIDDVNAADYRVYSINRNIVLKGAQGEMVDIYDVTGRVICHQVAADDNMRTLVPAAGVYMVRVNGKTSRVVVK